MRNETFRIGGPKLLISLGALNQWYRGIVCFQGLNCVFVSPFLGTLSLDRRAQLPAAPRAACRQGGEPPPSRQAWPTGAVSVGRRSWP